MLSEPPATLIFYQNLCNFTEVTLWLRFLYWGVWWENNKPLFYTKCVQCVPRPSVSSTETVFVAEMVTLLWQEPSSLSVMRRVSTGHSSATGPQVTAGVWTVEDRREREPELHPEPHLLTVMSLVRDSLQQRCPNILLWRAKNLIESIFCIISNYIILKWIFLYYYYYYYFIFIFIFSIIKCKNIQQFHAQSSLLNKQYKFDIG